MILLLDSIESGVLTPGHARPPFLKAITRTIPAGLAAVEHLSEHGLGVCASPSMRKLSLPFQVLLTRADYCRLQGLAKSYGIDSKGAVIRMLIRNWQTEAEKMGLIQT